MPGPPLKRVANAARRRPSRVRVTLDVEFASRRDLTRAIVGSSLDASLLVATDMLLPVGLEIGLRVSFPALTAPIELQGVVGWSEPGETGDVAGMRIALGRLPSQLRAELRRSGVQPVPRGLAAVPGDEPARASRIVVLESNALMRELMQYAFQSVAARKVLPNVHAEFTSSVSKCRTMLESGNALLIVDLDSVNAGVALLTELRKNDQLAGMPILAITTGVPPTTDDLTMVLRKPIALDQLLKTAELLLTKSGKRR